MKFYISLITIFSLLTGIYAQEVPEAKLLGQWFNPNIPSSTAHDNAYNEIWGLAVNDREFAVMGSTIGTHIIDVTDTDNIVVAAFIPGAAFGAGIIHRDYHDHDGYLYAVCDEGQSTLQIIDISDLPNSATVVYDNSELIQRSHNIFIDEDNDRLYSCATNGTVLGADALRVFDISDPENLVDLGGYNTFENYVVGHVHDAYVKDHVAYFNCGPDGMVVVDVSDLGNMKLLGSLESDDYPDSGYNHSGWLAEEGDVYYMADENHGLAIKAINVEDYGDLDVKTLFDAGDDSPGAIAHNLIVDGDRLFVSYYFQGLQVYDITDRESPQRIMHYPTSMEVNIDSTKYRGAWGVYPFLPSGNILVSDMQEGLFVVDRNLEISSNKESEKDVFGIYPNPAVDYIQVSLVDEGKYSYRIKDLSGKILMGGQILEKTQAVHTSQLQSGSYIIELLDGQHVYAQLFSITK